MPGGTRAPFMMAGSVPATVPTRLLVRRMASLLSTVAFCGAVLLAAAGGLAWQRAWAFLALTGLLLTLNLIVVVRTNPDVIAARAEKHRGTETFDKVFAVLYAPTFVGLLLVAGLDAGRFGWTNSGTPGLVLGALLLIGGDALILGALTVNPHLETTVRLQEDRGQRVVTDGPYRVVRHPMYGGMVLQNLGMPLFLGSLWALVPAVAMNSLLVVRTALEDGMLTRRLSGYEAFTHQTRFRLLPGVW